MTDGNQMTAPCSRVTSSLHFLRGEACLPGQLKAESNTPSSNEISPNYSRTAINFNIEFLFNAQNQTCWRWRKFRLAKFSTFFRFVKTHDISTQLHRANDAKFRTKSFHILWRRSHAYVLYFNYEMNFEPSTLANVCLDACVRYAIADNILYMTKERKEKKKSITPFPSFKRFSSEQVVYD
jgi:hypothetical protein